MQPPLTPLEESTSQLRDLPPATIAVVASWPGFAVSVATKVLHKKRSVLIPILDNEAIFGDLHESSVARGKGLARQRLFVLPYP